MESPHIILLSRGVPIIRSAKISATNMVIFTNIGIGTEQQEDRYHYRYLYSSNSLYINRLCIGFLRYLCGSLVPVVIVHSATSATPQEAIQIHAILVFVAGKLVTVSTNEAVI